MNAWNSPFSTQTTDAPEIGIARCAIQLVLSGLPESKRAPSISPRPRWRCNREDGGAVHPPRAAVCGGADRAPHERIRRRLLQPRRRLARPLLLRCGAPRLPCPPSLLLFPGNPPCPTTYGFVGSAVRGARGRLC
jgi:hypothetical protein